MSVDNRFPPINSMVLFRGVVWAPPRTENTLAGKAARRIRIIKTDVLGKQLASKKLLF